MRRARSASGATGSALVVVCTLMALGAALSATLVIATVEHTAIGRQARRHAHLALAADSGLRRAVRAIRSAPNVTAVLNGTWPLPDVGDLVWPAGSPGHAWAAAWRATCGRDAGCTERSIVAAAPGRRWGTRNPRWRPLQSVAWPPAAVSAGTDPPPTTPEPCVLVIMVADDPADADGDPLRDAEASAEAVDGGHGVLLIRADAFGAFGAQAGVEAAVAMPSPGVVRVLWWRRT